MNNTVRLYEEINQSGITHGPKKLALMQQACRLMEVPTSNLDSDLLRVKLFDPCGSWTWYVQDWDGEDICFGWVEGFENEWGSFSLRELSEIKGPLGIGIEIDVYFTPTAAKNITI
jgi:hypothetical protein